MRSRGSIFNIDPLSGVVTFKGPPNFEAPADAGIDKIIEYKFEISLLVSFFFIYQYVEKIDIGSFL